MCISEWRKRNKMWYRSIWVPFWEYIVFLSLFVSYCDERSLTLYCIFQLHSTVQYQRWNIYFLGRMIGCFWERQTSNQTDSLLRGLWTVESSPTLTMKINWTPFLSIHTFLQIFVREPKRYLEETVRVKELWWKTFQTACLWLYHFLLGMEWRSDKRILLNSSKYNKTLTLFFSSKVCLSLGKKGIWILELHFSLNSV
jgi:hypothetical protein